MTTSAPMEIDHENNDERGRLSSQIKGRHGSNQDSRNGGDDGDSEMAEDDEQREVLERRRLRQKYRQLILDSEENAQQMMQGSSDVILERLQAANNLYSKVKTANDAALDSKYLLLTSEIAAEKLKRSRNEVSTFDVQDFIGNCLKIMNLDGSLGNNDDIDDDDDERDNSELNWKALGRITQKYISVVPSPSFILGPLDIERKQKKVRAANVSTRQTKNKDELVRPTELKAIDIEKDENETTKNIRAVFDVLKEVGPLPYWSFVINPSSFSQTVENTFYCAFLAKDGNIELIETGNCKFPDCYVGKSLSDSMDIVIDPVAATEPLGENERAKIKRNQYMVSLDIDAYKKLITRYNITRSCIPTRAPSKSATGMNGKWYG